MKSIIVALSAVAFIATSSVGFAQGASKETPGHEMQTKGSKKGYPGASGYAPGHQMELKGSKTHPGAAGSAPGQTVPSSEKGTKNGY